jgi:hypothetical protein
MPGHRWPENKISEGEIERMYRNYNLALDYWHESLQKKCLAAWRKTTIFTKPSQAGNIGAISSQSAPLSSITLSPSRKLPPSRVPLSQLSRLAIEDSSGVNNVFQTIQNVRAKRLKLRSTAIGLDESYSYDRQNLSLTSRKNISIEHSTQVRTVQSPSLSLSLSLSRPFLNPHTTAHPSLADATSFLQPPHPSLQVLLPLAFSLHECKVGAN